MEKAKWTFMVYMAGDNSLDGAALKDIAEMARVGSTGVVNVLVQLDRVKDQRTRRFRITKGGGYAKDCIETFAETDTGDPQVLYNFVTWAVEQYPADRYCLILWNHGSGWWEDAKGRASAPAGKKARKPLFRHAIQNECRSICYDDTSEGDALDNSELKDVLSRACTILGKKIDILGMDACLMNMVEVAYQLRDSVSCIVGSEIEEPFDGWPYNDILSYLTANPDAATPVIAREFAKRYIRSYKGQGETVTQSSIDAGRIEDVMEKIDALAATFLSSLKDCSDAVDYAWMRSPRFYDDNYIDIACFARTLKKKGNADIRAKADDLLSSLKAGKGKAILYEGNLGKDVEGTCGLSIYFPSGKINPAYNTLDFAKDCRWADFLREYLS